MDIARSAWVSGYLAARESAGSLKGIRKMELTPTVAFAIIMAFSAIFVLATSLGGDHHGDGTDISHDTADFDDAGHGHGHSAHHGDGHEGSVTSDVFTFRTLFLFGTGFGGAGLIASLLGFNAGFSSLVGVGFGVFMAWIGIALFRLIRGQQSNTLTSLHWLENTEANVVTSIPPGGYGEIAARDQQGALCYLPAKLVTEDMRIAAGTKVEVVSIAGNTAVVRPLAMLAN